MNRDFLPEILAPLTVVPMAYIGVMFIHGSLPDSLSEAVELLVFVLVISLPVGVIGLLVVAVPAKIYLTRIGKLNGFNLVFLGGIFGGVIFLLLDILYMPGHSPQTFVAHLLVFSMGTGFGAVVTGSYVLLGGSKSPKL